MCTVVGLFFFCLAAALLPAACALAAGPGQSLGAAKIAESSQLPWTITADKLTYDQEKQLYTAEGNVKICSKDRTIDADFASVDNKTRQADLKGHVTVQYGRNWVKGEHITWNLDSETGWLETGILYFSQNNFFVQGKSITKLGPTEFQIKEGFVTSCNPSDPDWKIQFNDMKIAVGGTAWTHDVSFWARSWPLIYWPVMGLPVETERQSGFLLPLAGNSSLLGYEIEDSYYWAFRPDMDATVYEDYMTRRGIMAGAEYRVNNAELGKGVWMFNYLVDQASPTFLNDKGYPFQTQDRYWIRGKQDIELPWQISAKIDVDYVSDRNYLQEFTFGSASFPHSLSAFGSNFGRSILYDQTSLVRESDVYLEKKGESQLISLDTRFWENLEPTVKSQTTQELPSLSYSVIPKEIDGTPLYWGLRSSAVDYWRDLGDTEQRLDLSPRVYLPLHWGNYLDVQPSFALRSDSYAIQWAENRAGDFTERASPDVDIEMSTRLNREFNVNFLNFTELQNSIRPEVSYEYVAQASTGPNPLIDRLDQDLARNGVRYGFTTFLTGKQISTDAAGDYVTTYREIARLRVFQFFNAEPVYIPEPLFDTNEIMKEGLSPVGVRLDIMPTRNITASYDLDLDLSSTGQGKAQGLFLTYDSNTGYTFSVDYEQIPTLAVNEITLATSIRIYKDFFISTYHDYSISPGLMFTQGYGVRYIHGCWGIGAGYERSGGADQFVCTIDLLGIGSLGRESTFFGRPLYNESRPGYQHPENWMMQ
jgi:LPS-assembly protein